MYAPDAIQSVWLVGTACGCQRDSWEDTYALLTMPGHEAYDKSMEAPAGVNAERTKAEAKKLGSWAAEEPKKELFATGEGESESRVCFYAPSNPLSNFYPCALHVYGKWYSSAEAAFQARKVQLFGTPDQAAEMDAVLTRSKHGKRVARAFLSLTRPNGRKPRMGS